VARDPGARRYAPGPRLASLARNVMLNATLRSERHAILAQLVEEIGETCNFTMLDGDRVVYLDRVEAAWPLRMNLSSGSRVPLHCSASGKLLLAFLPKASRERIIGHISLTPYTATTLTDRRRLTAELARIRTNRYATDNEEFHAGLACVAVPVMDGRKRACAALAVHAPVSRMPLTRALEYLPQLRRAAVAMAQTLNS
jgi:DNA-binding IclR family transcriptional regulator